VVGAVPRLVSEGQVQGTPSSTGICVHRGTHEIGGTCIELESQGKRLVLDIGLPLDAADPAAVPLPVIPGFAAIDDSLMGVVISHAHQDHYGLAHRLPEKTPILIGEAAERILAAAAPFSPAGIQLGNTRHMHDRQPIHLPPFTITPYLVDHSAFDSYALLVEYAGRRIFYTGDLRAHGRKAILFERLLREPPTDVDVLLIEGTTVGRPASADEPAIEDDLVDRFVELFDPRGLALVWASAQNIDRIVSLYKACRRSGRLLVIDVYTAHLLAATGLRSIPRAHWRDIRVFLPASQKSRIIRTKRFDLVSDLRSRRIFPEEILAVADHSVMLFRPSMIRDLDAIEGLEISRMIHSLWPGYLEGGRSEALLEWLERRGISIVHCHTSGHATPNDLVRFRRAFPSATAVPVHTASPDAAAALFDPPVRVLSDREWYALGSE
jgi:ribonuclease J